MCEKIVNIFKNFLGNKINSSPEELNYQTEVEDQRAMLITLGGGVDDSKNTVNYLDIQERPVTVHKA